MLVDIVGQPISGTGRVLFHEHIQFGWPGFELDPEACHAIDEDFAVSTLTDLADSGVTVLVDATPIECGRNLALLQSIARRSPVQLLAATGIYQRERGFPMHLAALSVDELVDLHTENLQPGREGGHASVLKVASAGVPFAKREAKAIEAAGIVSSRLDTPIVTHTDGTTTAAAQLEILLSAGARPARIALGHLDSASSSELAKLIGEGVFVGIDRFGHGDAEADAARVRLVAELLGLGLGGSVLIAHDAALRFLGRFKVREDSAPNPFTHIERAIVPLLREAGLSEHHVTQLLELNPRRFLTGAPS